MSIDLQAIAYSSQKSNLTPPRVAKVLEFLLVEEFTIPFITRYRKEATGGLDEVEIGKIKEFYEEYVEREKRREFILDAIKKQEKLTPELEKNIKAAETLNQLEDIYAPYKRKQKTKGDLAREKGLEPLSVFIKTSGLDLTAIEKMHGAAFINPEKKIENFAEALSGAQDILVDELAHHLEIKEVLRADYWKGALLKSTLRDKAQEVKEYEKFKDYFEFEQKASDLKNAKYGHRVLAMRRGADLKVLRVEVAYDELAALKTVLHKGFDLSLTKCVPTLEECAQRAYTRSIHPSLESEIKAELKVEADQSAIGVFAINLKNLLLQPYLGAKGVLAIDPGVRTGCKVAVIDRTGKFVVDTVIYPHPPQNDKEQAKHVVKVILKECQIEYIAIGNGTFGRETLEFLKEHIDEVKTGKVKALLVNEDGASIYSVSEIARQEFPDKDPTVRGAISIGRRFQDPLAELVKIDPKSIGVGQYQHDVNHIKLQKSLEGVVENCVNYVGVDLNTASAPLLSYISGVGPSLAKNMVKEREKKGGFKSRGELLSIGRFSAKVYQQAAGFLRIYQGDNPLDGTFIHPERYPVIENWCQSRKLSVADLIKTPDLIAELERDHKLIEELGEFTHKDIVAALRAPSQDPRSQFQSFGFRNDISTIADLKIGEYYPGQVTNITQFGAFVDIGIKENGLIHVSQMSDKFVENALEVLKVGQEVKARVVSVDLERKRVGLSLKKGEINRDREQQVANSGSSSGKRDRSSGAGSGAGGPRRNFPKAPEKLKNNPFANLTLKKK